MWFSKAEPDVRAALVICKNCPVRKECLALADKFETGANFFGIWGGELPHERQKRRGIDPEEKFCKANKHLVKEVGSYINKSGTPVCRGCLSEGGRRGAASKNS